MLINPFLISAILINPRNLPLESSIKTNPNLYSSILFKTSIKLDVSFSIGHSSFESINSFTLTSECITDDLSISNDFAISLFTRYDPDTIELTPNVLRMNAISSFTPPSTWIAFDE